MNCEATDEINGQIIECQEKATVSILIGTLPLRFCDKHYNARIAGEQREKDLYSHKAPDFHRN